MIVKNRIKKHSEFQEVIGNGKTIRSNSFTFYVLENSLGYTRVGISVPKKAGIAVIRNKIKRQIRACIAESTDYSKSFDLVIIVRKSYNVEKFSETKNEIQNLFEKVGQTSEKEN